jgi:hypothetical protein
MDWVDLAQDGDIAGLDVDGRIILKWILKKQARRAWAGFTWLRIGTLNG